MSGAKGFSIRKRAAFTLKHARLNSPWLAVSLEGFGRSSVAPVNGLLAVGDAASFIDPFTGSGMLMALESGELVADVIVRNRKAPSLVTAEYASEYIRKFDSRLRISGWLRRAAFNPRLAGLGIGICGASKHFRSRIARATRSPKRDHHTPLRAG